MADHLDADALLDAVSAGVVVHDATSRIVYANPKALELLGITADQALGRTAFDPRWHFLDEGGQRLAVEAYPANRVLASDEGFEDRIFGIVTGDAGPETWVSATAYAERDGAGAIARVVVTFVDITARKRGIPFESIISAANDAVIVTEAGPLDAPGPRIVYVNAAFTEITGYTAEEAIGRNPRMLQGPDTAPETMRAIRGALEREEPVRQEILNYAKDGRPYWLDLNIVPLRNALGEVAYYAAIERDVSEHKRQLTELSRLSATDPLTGLHNRRGFESAGARVLAAARRDGSPVAVAVLDLDHFKRVNDEHGHDAGDRALEHVGAILRRCFRGEDVTARLGGEEFAVLLPRADEARGGTIAERFRRRLARSAIALPDGSEVRITVSIGLAVAGAATAELESLVKRADAALYKAKREGRNRTVIASTVPDGG